MIRKAYLVLSILLLISFFPPAVNIPASVELNRFGDPSKLLEESALYGMIIPEQGKFSKELQQQIESISLNYDAVFLFLNYSHERERDSLRYFVQLPDERYLEKIPISQKLTLDEFHSLREPLGNLEIKKGKPRLLLPLEETDITLAPLPLIEEENRDAYAFRVSLPHEHKESCLQSLQSMQLAFVEVSEPPVPLAEPTITQFIVLSLSRKTLLIFLLGTILIFTLHLIQVNRRRMIVEKLQGISPTSMFIMQSRRHFRFLVPAAAIVFIITYLLKIGFYFSLFLSAAKYYTILFILFICLLGVIQLIVLLYFYSLPMTDTLSRVRVLWRTALLLTGKSLLTFALLSLLLPAIAEGIVLFRYKNLYHLYANMYKDIYFLEYSSWFPEGEGDAQLLYQELSNHPNIFYSYVRKEGDIWLWEMNEEYLEWLELMDTQGKQVRFDTDDKLVLAPISMREDPELKKMISIYARQGLRPSLIELRDTPLIPLVDLRKNPEQLPMMAIERYVIEQGSPPLVRSIYSLDPQRRMEDKNEYPLSPSPLPYPVYWRSYASLAQEREDIALFHLKEQLKKIALFGPFVLAVLLAVYQYIFGMYKERIKVGFLFAIPSFHSVKPMILAILFLDVFALGLSAVLLPDLFFQVWKMAVALLLLFDLLCIMGSLALLRRRILLELKESS